MKKAILYIISTIILISCKENASSIVSVGLKELKRITSPDQLVDAILIETNGGATTSFGNMIFLVKKGGKITQKDLELCQFNCDDYSGIDFKWQTNKLLEITYSKARIFHYSNFWGSDDLDHWNYIVEIQLHCLSPGDQLYWPQPNSKLH